MPQKTNPSQFNSVQPSFFQKAIKSLFGHSLTTPASRVQSVKGSLKYGMSGTSDQFTKGLKK